MPEILVPPYAPVLIESMRSIGYTLESAIADLIDNSLSARASRVDIQFRPHGDPYVAIIDDGEGMDPSQLTEAMRHGSRNPLEQRSKNDLGRFGLGLKTASLSQCRKLTVISYKEGILSARCWDLDLIAERKEWVLLVEDSSEEIHRMPHVQELEKLDHGTIVLWQGLDRLAAGEVSIESALGQKMDRTRDHLSLVFHRYLTGETGLSKVQLFINNNLVDAADPFLGKHGATQKMYEEAFAVDGHKVHVHAFILPHISKMTHEELAKAGGEEGLRRKQGFYIYRNKRLIIWGTWFLLMRQKELTKLARVRVDIPNSLDHLWTLDIKKSVAYPPEEVRFNLRRIVDKISERSKRTYTYRGRRTNDDGLTRTWDRITGRGGIRYAINRQHPVVSALNETLEGEQEKLFDLLLETVETTFPADALYADMADDKPRSTSVENPEKSLRELVTQLVAAIDSVGKRTFLASLHKIEPFSNYPDITASITEEFANAE